MDLVIIKSSQFIYQNNYYFSMELRKECSSDSLIEYLQDNLPREKTNIKDRYILLAQFDRNCFDVAIFSYFPTRSIELDNLMFHEISLGAVEHDGKHLEVQVTPMYQETAKKEEVGYKDFFLRLYVPFDYLGIKPWTKMRLEQIIIKNSSLISNIEIHGDRYLDILNAASRKRFINICFFKYKPQRLPDNLKKFSTLFFWGGISIDLFETLKEWNKKTITNLISTSRMVQKRYYTITIQRPKILPLKS